MSTNDIGNISQRLKQMQQQQAAMMMAKAK